jgi:hypothetical protein
VNVFEVDVPSEQLREALEFAVANGWRPAGERPNDEASERPTLAPPDPGGGAR